jgi:excisionase family DNA binding protein
VNRAEFLGVVSNAFHVTHAPKSPALFFGVDHEEARMQRRKPQADPIMWTVRDVADYLQCSKKFAYQLVQRPGCPRVILSTKFYRVRREEFLRWLEAQPETAPLIAARALEDARTHPAEAPCVWEKRGNGSTPRALARTPDRV